VQDDKRELQSTLYRNWRCDQSSVFCLLDPCEDCIGCEAEDEMPSDQLKSTNWQPIGDAPAEIDEIAHYAIPPQIGQHVGRCYTLLDGRWVVIKFSNPGGKPESYFILPEPARG